MKHGVKTTIVHIACTLTYWLYEHTFQEAGQRETGYHQSSDRGDKLLHYCSSYNY